MKKRYFLLFMLCAMLFVACGSEEKQEKAVMDVDIMYDENGDSYWVKNGTERWVYQVPEDTGYCFEVSISKTQGSFSLWIAKDGIKEDAIYEGNDISLSYFTVNVEEKGEYILWVEVEDFVGEYSLEMSEID